MKLIYAYIGEFRNINKQSFCFDRRYEVELIEQEPDHYRIEIKDNNEYINIMKRENVENITVLVGRNGSGKTSWLLAMAELIESYENSKFVYVYLDGEDFYIECNKVFFMDFNKEYHYSGLDSRPPEVSIYKMNFHNKIFEEVEKNKKRTEKLAYIMVRHKINEMTHSYANTMYSNIPRNGVVYNERSIYYKYRYLFYQNGRAKEFNNKHLKLEIELDKKYLLYYKRKIHLLPELYPGESCFFDAMPSGSDLYKKAFLLRLVEFVVSQFREIGDEVAKSYIERINKIAEENNFNVDFIYNEFDNIISIVCELHKALLEKNYTSNTETHLCFNEFLYQVKRFVELLPCKFFEKTTKLVISFEMIKQLKIEEILECVLMYYDTRNVLQDYKSIINFEIIGLSDGYEFISNLYAAIFSSFRLFQPIEKQKIILVLDEPDCFMHPEWSRRFIVDLYDFLNNEFSKYNFEVILTTHSPYILTDIPSENIIFLDNGKVKEIEIKTFGQNIHSLLKNTFFLDSTIGEFSLLLINKIYSKLVELKNNPQSNISDKEKEMLWKEICIIGEPLVQWKLEKFFYECFPGEKEDSIKMYKDEIKRLKEKLSVGSEKYDKDR